MTKRFRAASKVLQVVPVVAGAVLLVAAVPAAAAVPAPVPTVITAHAAPASPTVGGLLTVQGSVSPALPAATVLQELVSGAWTTVSGTYAGSGGLTATLRMPAAPTTLSLRLARSAGSGVLAGVSATLVVPVLEPRGTVLAWGSNANHQLGAGTPAAFSDVPADVVGVTDAVAVAGAGSAGDGPGSGAGYALKSDGTVWAWGRNNHGGLGNGTFRDSKTAVQVVGLTGVKAIAAGIGTGYALRSDGSVWAWGFNALGQLGDGNEYDRPLAAPVLGLSGVTALAAADESVYALRSNGDVWSWGRDVTESDFDTPLLPHPWAGRVQGISAVTAIAADNGNGFAVRADGTVWEWGGIFTDHDHRTPAPIAGLTGVLAVASTWQESYALLDTGQVEQFATDTQNELISAVPGMSGVTKVAASGVDGDLYALTAVGTVLSYGVEQSGELGNGVQVDSPTTAVTVTGLRHARAIGAGSLAGYAVVG